MKIRCSVFNIDGICNLRDCKIHTLKVLLLQCCVRLLKCWIQFYLAVMWLHVAQTALMLSSTSMLMMLLFTVGAPQLDRLSQVDLSCGTSTCRLEICLKCF